MKKIIGLFICLFCSVAIIAQVNKKQGDDMAKVENYSGAAMMYRLCMQKDEECLIKLIRLLYEEKVEPQFSNELYQLVNPLAEKGNAEAQFYVGGMYHQGLGVKKDMDEALKWYQKSKDQGYEAARKMYDELMALQKQNANPVYDNNIVASSSFGGGTGTQNDPFLIANTQQLKKLVDEANDSYDYSNTCFKLVTDIEVTANEWIPIGYAYAFIGIFDGNGHTISGMLKSANYENFGFFGKLGQDARVSNLTIAATVKHEGKFLSTTRSTFAQTGAIAGVHNGKNVLIENCHITGTVTGGIAQNVRTGGILGYGNEGITIRNCDVSNDVIGGNSVGISGFSQTSGIAGILMGEISNCTVLKSAKITGGDAENIFYSRTGGITGENHGKVVDCTNQADVSGTGLVGGLAGVNFSIIHTSLNTGRIANTSGAASHSGNLVGFNSDSSEYEAHIYSCCTNRNSADRTGALIGRGKAVDPCPDGHKKR